MQIFRFPLHIRPGFAMFMILIVVINGLPMGLWLAGSVTVFTLVHELGHAFAARHTGAQASITLDFLVGYASFRPTRPLSHGERISISAAGPLIQISLGVVVLMLIGVNPLNHHEFTASYRAFAIWWAGPMIGLFNLIPVLPLDGGNISAEIIDYFAPGKGHSLMARLSVPLTAGALAAIVVVDSWRPLAVFAALLLVMQLQTLSTMSATRPDKAQEILARQRRLAAEAEDSAWLTGRPGILAAGQVISPWWDAYSLLRAGHSSATTGIIEDLQNTSPERAPWWPPNMASNEQLEAIMQVLPRPLPPPQADTAFLSAHTLITALRRTGRGDEAAHYAAAVYQAQPSVTSAIEVARCVILLGEFDIAAQWLTIAGRVDDNSEALLWALDNVPEFSALRQRTDIKELLMEISHDH